MNLKTSICGIDLKNPLMPASGPLTGDFEKMNFLYKSGVGAMVTKTISIKGAEVIRPCIYGEKNFIMNNELWSEYSYKKWIHEILPKAKKEFDIPLIVSAGYTKEDMEFLIPKLDEFADIFEISTHYVGKDLNKISEIVKTIRKYTKKPLFIKMSPHIPEPIEFVKKIMESGANGVVAINSLGPTMKIDLETRSTLLGNKDGFAWTSGPVIKPLSLALIHEIHKNVPNAVIIGTGGVEKAEDIIEFLLAGASGVQMLSSALIKGKDLYKKIINSLPKKLEKYGFSSIEHVIESKILTRTPTFTPNHPKIDNEKCTLCKLCENVCPYFAITVNEKVIVDNKKCFGCGLCESRCPTKAISNVL
ncbi:diguanylate cyclase [Tepiditoga spiralis]|uniref:dihydrouracil dehydrogenase (NAD(+)) n=1 Tax=Tepiditoga spiralis TaxID=2108365 RepID=A0A7G1G1G3_9BACT|nr:4Fe-4S binding protein [Tepiditoga spiralis]BBE30008.1 diguanylate cyclase [Tepiditoga spiralis]